MSQKASFMVRFAFIFLGVVSVTSFLASLNGCATLRDHSAAVELVASQAALRYIDAQPNKIASATRVVAVCDEILAQLVADDVTVAQLAATALRSIPETLDPADRQLALAVINVARQELQKRFGEGTIVNPDDIVSTRSLVTSIRDAARLYIRME